MTASDPLFSSKFHESAIAARSAFETRSAAINGDTNLSAAGKARALESLRDATLTALDEAEAGYLASIEKRKKELQHRLLDRNPAEGHDPALTISYRDAVERISRLISEDPRRIHTQAVELMNWALRNEDVPMERALLRVAFDHRWDAVVNAFIDRSPRPTQEAAEELWELTDPDRIDYSTLVFHPTTEMISQIGTSLTSTHIAQLSNTQNRWLAASQ